MKLADRARKDGVHATRRLPAPHRAVDAGVVNFRTTQAILIDRQCLSLASHIKHLQNVVEYPVQT